MAISVPFCDVIAVPPLILGTFAAARVERTVTRSRAIEMKCQSEDGYEPEEVRDFGTSICEYLCSHGIQ